MEVKPVSLTNSFERFNPKEQEVKSVTDVVQEKMKEKQTQLAETKTTEVTREDLESSIKGVNSFLEVNFTSLKFQVHEDLNRLFVEVVDRNTQEVVREIPPKEFLDMISSMLDHVGLIIDKRI